MKKICIIGRNGFIGSHVAANFELNGYEVTSTPSKEVEAIFDFGSPVHPPFEENPDYYMKTLLPRHLEFLSMGKYYIYASSALVYEKEKDISFMHFKKVLEELALAYPKTPSLGLRIFPVYGPGENRTFISQACEAMSEGKRPVIFGNGKQKRDFIFINDAAAQIMDLFWAKKTGIQDVGNGNPVTFNSVIKDINKLLGTSIKPIYKKAPAGYSRGIVCQNPGKSYTNIYYGCKRILEQ